MRAWIADYQPPTWEAERWLVMLTKGVDRSLDKRQLYKWNHGVACRLNGLVCVQAFVFAVHASRWFNLHANEYTVRTPRRRSVPFFDQLKQSSAKWNVFSKADTLGTFDFMTLTVALDKLSQNDITRLVHVLSTLDYKRQLENRQLSHDYYELISNVLPLAFHEYTHFIDATSTPWGIDFLRCLNKGYQTDPDRFGVSELDYHLAKKLHDQAREIRLPKYYTAVTPGVDSERPWKYQITSGRWFTADGGVSDRPILFVAFSNSADKRIVRSPLSVVSLLEASAMAQELMCKSFLVHALSEDSRVVESSLFSEATTKHIYNPELTEYSVCAHLVANSLKLANVFDALRVAARIVHLCLNATSELFDQIELSQDARRKLHLDASGSEYENNIRLALRWRDRGFLFYLLTALLDECDLSSNESMDQSIISAANLLSIDIQRSSLSARRYVELRCDELQRSPFLAISEISKCSLANFDQRESNEGVQYDFTRFEVPPVLLGDNTVAPLEVCKDGRLRQLDIERSYGELVKGQLWIERFSEACA